MSRLLTQVSVFMVALSMLFALSQLAIDKINPGGNNTFYNPEGSPICKAMVGGCESGTYNPKQFSDQDVGTAETTVDPDSGNIFTDVFNTIKNWALRNPISSAVFYIVTGPYTFLYSTGLPQEAAAIVAGLFYAIGILLIMNYFAGRGD